jgi:hypothetical protein
MDPLVRYLEDQLQLNAKDSGLLAKAMNELGARINRDQTNLERMRGALDRFYAEHAQLKDAHAKRLAEIAQPPEESAHE